MWAVIFIVITELNGCLRPQADLCAEQVAISQSEKQYKIVLWFLQTSNGQQCLAVACYC